MPNPYLSDPDVTLYHGDALTVLQTLEDASVHCCVTSPPFYGLRDYGTGAWDGGDPDCDHLAPPGGGFAATGLQRDGRSEEARQGNAERIVTDRRQQYRDLCGKCGARRVDQQIGLEETPEQWVQSLVAVFREVRRVLRPDGTLWLEVGDSYSGGGGYLPDSPANLAGSKQSTNRGSIPSPDRGARNAYGQRAPAPGLKPKDLSGAPWQLAFALRADGWYLRSDIIWARPNPMPESVTDRPTKAHSYIFLLTKRPRYFFDQEAVREQATWERWGGQTTVKYDGQGQSKAEMVQRRSKGEIADRFDTSQRNVRSVWTIPTQPYPEAHFATFPEALARRCILAGTSERGCCPECGTPWQRQIEEGELKPVRGEYLGPVEGHKQDGSAEVIYNAGKAMVRTTEGWSLMRREKTTLGWRPSCGHGDDDPFRPEHTAPCVVLDPFVGSGTVPYVARLHGRHSIGIDLNASYLALAAKRLAQQSLFAHV